MDAHCQTPPYSETKSGFITQPEVLRTKLSLAQDSLPLSTEAAQDFVFKVPAAFVERMNRGDAQDPLLKQVWPAVDEEIDTPGFHRDPLGEEAATVAPGLLRKYQGRALLIVSGACAVHCRYCFRRHFPYGEHQLDDVALQAAIAQIHADQTLSEIILSGGDPLILSNRRLDGLLRQLAAIPHIRRLRIHSRVPIVLPRRIDKQLVEIFTPYASRLVLVVHANHAQELNADVRDQLLELRNSGMTLLNQTVLLRGVNDSAADLVQLSDALFTCGVLPYYLHQLDPVAGAAHFQVSDQAALEIMAKMRDALPGYLVPRLVREQAGASSKQPVFG